MVKDRAVHRDVIESIAGFALENGFGIRGLSFSPIKGPEGNIEYLMHLTRKQDMPADRERLEEEISRLVEESHSSLD